MPAASAAMRPPSCIMFVTAMMMYPTSVNPYMPCPCQDHPSTTSLDLSHNPFKDRTLARLLQCPPPPLIHHNYHRPHVLTTPHNNNLSTPCPFQDHPSITSLDLSHNPIGDSGGVVLVALLEANPRLITLNVEGTHFMR